MGIEEEPEQEQLREGDLDARIHEVEEPSEETAPQKPPENDEDLEIEKMSRQVPPEITEGMLGG